MATQNQPDDELNRPPIDPAPLGADQGPVSRPEDDPRDMSTIMADPNNFRDQAGTRDLEYDAEFGHGLEAGQGSHFDQQRRQGATGSDDRPDDVGRGHGLGHAGFNGDEDRGYDQSGHRGGLGTSGGRENLADRHVEADTNPFTGGYGGGDYDRPADSTSQRIGLNTPNPTNESAPRPDDDSSKSESETT